eukprot:12290096-Prorocentrum_lima.AAC.1
MTSSLVGSEMCIRDRASALCCPSRIVSTVGSAKSRNQRSRKQPLPLAVSYTHLTLPTICSV